MIDPSVFVAPGAHILGQVNIGAESSIWFGSIVRGDVDTITIGHGCNVQDGAVIHVSRGFPVVLEDWVSVAHGAVVHGSYIEEGGTLIGIGAIVLDGGARVGKETVVGAGSLVVGGGTVIPPRSLVLGQPARVVRELSDEEVESFRETAYRYVKYAQRYLKNEWK